MRAAMVVLVLAACDVPRTQLMIGVVTDIHAPDLIDSAQLVVTRGDNGAPIANVPWEISGSPNQPFNLPGSYGVYSDGEELQVDVVLTAYKGSTPVVTRRALLGLVTGKTLFFRMGLTAGCRDRTDCSTTQSCAEGVCRDLEVPAVQLPDFNAELVDNLTCNSGTTYISTSTGQPMPYSPDAGQCPSELCREGTCLKPMPGGGGGVVVDAGDTISCGDPFGDGCYTSGSGSCACDAMCGSKTHSLRCEGTACTCMFDGAVTLTFTRSDPTARCFDEYAQCPPPN